VLRLAFREQMCVGVSAANGERGGSEISKVTSDMAMSVDGLVAGPNQSLDNPFGEGVEGRLHQWMFDEPDANAPEIEAMTAAGAFIMGRNMFGPGRGDWDEDWKGWWGDEPPYHSPVFVLTHHAREALTMKGGTTFTFVTDGIEPRDLVCDFAWMRWEWLHSTASGSMPFGHSPWATPRSNCSATMPAGTYSARSCGRPRSSRSSLHWR
jgi:dihydrofolate reductase